MMCYMDMTFCSYYERCENRTTCRRQLTEEVKENAKKYGIDICQFMGKPNCYEVKKMNKKDLKELYNVDFENNYTNKKYVGWLEDRYLKLEELFDSVNTERIDLIVEKHLYINEKNCKD